MDPLNRPRAYTAQNVNRQDTEPQSLPRLVTLTTHNVGALSSRALPPHKLQQDAMTR